jgi:hypothetical protein
MKIFFSLLLIANIAFALVQWLLPYEQLVPSNNKIPVAEQLHLIDEPLESEMIAEAEVSEAVQEDEVVVAEEIIDQRLCYTIGPFKDKTRALEVSARYSNKDVRTELKSNLEKEYLGIMVYISGHKSRKAAVNTATSLAKKGFRESLIINETGKTNALSLGVFGLKKNADRLIAKLKKLKYPVRSEPRYRERTIYWVYNEQSNESNIFVLLDTSDVEKGISQIPRQCSESA